MRMLRRQLLLTALMVWQGGFMFYGGVVVPVGAEVLDSHRTQGFVTQRVTDYLNGFGAICLGAWAWDMTAGRGSGPGGRRTGWIGLVLLTVLLVAQVTLHPRLDALLDHEGFNVIDRSGYRNLHQWYLTLSTVQWAVAIALMGWTLRAWRAEDVGVGGVR
jgi:hypothetical protein